MDAVGTCPLCGVTERQSVLAEAAWVDGETEARLQARKPDWRRHDGACPACVQQALLSLLLEKGEGVLGRVVQDVWPLDANAAFGALPTPLRLRADPRFTGKDVTVAVIDAGFFPHDDLVLPTNRVRAWVDVAEEHPTELLFGANDQPAWPGASDLTPSQWHGLMTSTTLAGNGWRSHGLYRGLASEAELVLLQVKGADGRIGSRRVARALRWILANGERYSIRVVNASIGVAPDDDRSASEIDELIASLVARGVSVVVASGNDGQRSLALPATSPSAITVGGLDDGNTFDLGGRAIWHSNFGVSSNGLAKPELVAPSIWIVAPILPGTEVAREAAGLFERRAASDHSVEARIAELRLVTPNYQHVEGTSFASPIVSGVVACMLEANNRLLATDMCHLLTTSCHQVSGAASERQGAGAIDAGRAVAAALAVLHGARTQMPASPVVSGRAPSVHVLDHRARSVQVLGSWNDWQRPGTAARQVEPGLWTATISPLPDGEYVYKIVLDDTHWIADPSNPRRISDGLGGWNSHLQVSDSVS